MLMAGLDLRFKEHEIWGGVTANILISSKVSWAEKQGKK